MPHRPDHPKMTAFANAGVSPDGNQDEVSAFANGAPLAKTLGEQPTGGEKRIPDPAKVEAAFEDVGKVLSEAFKPTPTPVTPPAPETKESILSVLNAVLPGQPGQIGDQEILGRLQAFKDAGGTLDELTGPIKNSNLVKSIFPPPPDITPVTFEPTAKVTLQTLLPGVDTTGFAAPDEIPEDRDLASIASEQLQKFITGELPDRFARNSRDQFNKFVNQATDQLQIQNQQGVASGQISLAEGAANISQQLSGFANARAGLETTIAQNRETTIVESIKNVSSFLVDQAGIKNIDAIVDSRTLNDTLKMVAGGVLTKAAGRLSLINSFPALQSLGVFDAQGQIREEFRDPSQLETMSKELERNGLTKAEANDMALWLLHADAKILRLLTPGIILKAGEEGGLSDDQIAQEMVNVINPAGNPDGLTLEDAKTRVVNFRKTRRETELEKDLAAAELNPLGTDSLKLIADPETPEATKKKLVGLVADEIIKGEDVTAANLLTDKKAGDPIFDEVFKRADTVTSADTVLQETGINIWNFTKEYKAGSFVKIQGKLFKIDGVDFAIKDVNTQFLQLINVETNQIRYITAKDTRRLETVKPK